jgi:hypothetical protein
VCVYVTCITIIDTIIHHILNIHYNDAYFSMTMTYWHMTYDTYTHTFEAGREHSGHGASGQ